jgi:hypothetical protein
MRHPFWPIRFSICGDCSSRASTDRPTDDGALSTTNLGTEVRSEPPAHGSSNRGINALVSQYGGNGKYRP